MRSFYISNESAIVIKELLETEIDRVKEDVVNEIYLISLQDALSEMELNLIRND